MAFNYNYVPKEQLDQGGLLPAGEYQFVITSVETHDKEGRVLKTAKGDQKIIITHAVRNADGRMGTIKNHIASTMQWKLAQLADSVGVNIYNESGSFEERELVSKTGWCEIVISPARDQFKESNNIKEYIAKAYEANTGSKVPDDGFDQEVPF